MNYIDLILVLIAALAVWAGWKKGFILGTINLLVWIGSLLAGFVFYHQAAAWLQSVFPGIGVWSTPLAFLLIIVFVRLVMALIFNVLLRQTPDSVHTNGANRAMGFHAACFTAVADSFTEFRLHPGR